MPHAPAVDQATRVCIPRVTGSASMVKGLISLGIGFDPEGQ